MNFLELCQAVRSESGIGGGGPQAVTNQAGMLGRIVSWVRQEARKLEEAEDWRFRWRQDVLTLIPGQASYTGAQLGVPTLGKILAHSLTLQGSASGRLAVRPAQALLQAPAASGVPRLVARLPDGRLQFYPTPDEAYTVGVQHLRTASVLAANADQLLIPDEGLQWIVVWAALQRYARHVADMDAMGHALEGYAPLWGDLCERHLDGLEGPAPLGACDSEASLYL